MSRDLTAPLLLGLLALALLGADLAGWHTARVACWILVPAVFLHLFLTFPRPSDLAEGGGLLIGFLYVACGTSLLVYLRSPQGIGVLVAALASVAAPIAAFGLLLRLLIVGFAARRAAVRRAARWAAAGLGVSGMAFALRSSVNLEGPWIQIAGSLSLPISLVPGLVGLHREWTGPTDGGDDELLRKVILGVGHGLAKHADQSAQLVRSFHDELQAEGRTDDAAQLDSVLGFFRVLGDYHRRLHSMAKAWTALHLQRTRFGVGDLLRRTLPDPPPRGIQIELDVEDDADAFCDIDLYEMAVRAVLENATEAAHSRVAVRLRCHQRMARVSVQDDGPGVPSEIHDEIFETEFTTKPEGSGIGLPFARYVAERHGGSLILEPTETGACFTLTLPVLRLREPSGPRPT